MEALAFVEELGRHGEVVRRHALKHLPARIGRGYAADVILDDPCVAAEHVEIRLGTDGALEIVDLGSLNGTLRRGASARIGTTRIHGDDVLRIGQTQLRIRLSKHAVAAELPLPRRTWRRHPASFVVSATLLAALMMLDGYQATFDMDTSGLFSVPVMVSLGVLSWTAVWSLICRTLHGSGHFWAHGVVAFLGGTVLVLVGALTEYFYFSFDLGGLDLGWRYALAAIFAAILYQHLHLTVRLPPRTLSVLAASLAAIVLIGSQGYQLTREASKPGLQAFDKTIRPGALLFARGITPAEFVASSETLKAKGDRDAELMTK